MKVTHISHSLRTRFLPRIGLAALAAVGLLVSTAWEPAHARHYAGRNLVQLMERDGRLTTLLAALDAAGLKETVATTRNLTLFAPTDDAFAVLPEGTVESLLGDIPALSNILLYHVLGSTQTAYRLLSASTVETLQGSPVLVLREGTQLQVNGQPVVSANLRAGNGLLHAIGGVLIPPSEAVSVASMVDVLQLDGRFTVLLAALEAAGLTSTLEGSGSFTLLAPTDEAFARLPAGTLEYLLANPDTLKNILLYHVVSGDLNTAERAAQRSATTLQGSKVRIHSLFGRTYVNNAYILDGNNDAANGTFHAISRVLIPSWR